MIDISVHELNKYYGSNHVIRGVTFEIYKGEKIGLLGKNGSGKTTLFRVIAEDEPYESGSISKATGKKVEILAQIPIFSENDTVEDILRSSFKEITEIYEAMKKIEGDENPSVLTRYGKLMEEYERLGGYEVETKIEKICNGMNIGEVMRSRLFRLLSGGEKTRVNLARILLRDCDILLLDEPTNHLDLASLAWLEGFIREFPGTVVVISHDRVFLDNVITRVVEISEGKAHFYSGNYSWYAEEKMRRFIFQSQQYERQQKEVKRLEERAKWFVEQNQFTTKHHAMYSRIDHILKNKIEKPVTSRKVAEDFNSGGYAAKEAVSFNSVHKSYGANVLLNGVNLSIKRNDRIALIGANGCGKTTLLRMITGEEPCDSGEVKVSSNIKIAYMSQIILFDNDNATVLETLRNPTGLPEAQARSLLSRFLFKDVLKKVGNLSGGEKSRLKLCLLMQNKANFLILDEPTNHLDIDSREWIEDAVADFEGTMLFISHDRYFLNKFAQKIWSMKNGEITEFVGSFDDYVKINSANVSQPKTLADKKKNPPHKAKEPPKPKVETQIYEAEACLNALNREIEVHSSSLGMHGRATAEGCDQPDYEKLDALYQEKLRLEERIAVLYDEWS